MYFLYILYSQSRDKYYVGSTKDLLERLRRHRSNHKGFTGTASDWELAYSAQYSSKREVLVREKEVKSWKSRKRIIALSL
jgi:putative endonuclease